MQGGSQMSGSHMPPQMGQPPMIPNQPMHSNQPSMMNMGGPSPYSGESSFNQSPAPSQPQVPNMVRYDPHNACIYSNLPTPYCVGTHSFHSVFYLH